jgi:rhamnosyltransferase
LIIASSISKKTIAAGVILYRPNSDVIANICSYSHMVSEVFVYDNSCEKSNVVVDQIKQVLTIQYLTDGKNVGIAKALNEIAHAAFKKGYHYLLTMDQDSCFSTKNIDLMLNVFKSDSQIGIVSPLHSVENDREVVPNGEYEEVLTTMTSGNILNLSVWNALGGFDEKLFIDYVDHEYCLRLKFHGYRVVRANNTRLDHIVGNLQSRRFLFWTVRPTNHAPFRIFYQTRNRFYLKKKYGKIFPAYFRSDSVAYWRGIIKMFFYEREKQKKLQMIVKGWLALWRNDFRPLPLDE